MEGASLKVAYGELFGELEPRIGRPPNTDWVGLSNVHQGEQTSPGAMGLAVRFVGRGRESYLIDGRGHHVSAGQVMVAPHVNGANCEVRRVDRSGTFGICILIHCAPAELAWARAPLVFSERDSRIGALLGESSLALAAAQESKLEMARTLVFKLKAELPVLAGDILSQEAAVLSAKPSTRFEMVRRAHLARAYLDANTDRTVELAELGRAVGVSHFRLLTSFHQCFHETPAAYHRKLRMRLALEEARRRRAPIAAIVDEFGFASASSFSHAYRRAFGRPPTWAKAAGCALPTGGPRRTTPGGDF